MMKSVTFTGIDIRADIDALPESAFGFEYGVLYAETPEGRNRYPSKDVAHERLLHLRHTSRLAALHVCGMTARLALVVGELQMLTGLVQRIQINGSVQPDELQCLCSLFPDHVMITQHSGANRFLARSGIENHAILVDGSGGRGQLPSEWRRPSSTQAVGFAGGLGPLTIQNQLAAIQACASGEWWIDMESGIRDDNDWFDCEKVHEVVQLLSE